MNKGVLRYASELLAPDPEDDAGCAKYNSQGHIDKNRHPET